MTISITDVAAIVGITAAIVGVPCLIVGLFLGARLVRPRPANGPSDRSGTLIELLQFLREALTAVRELRNDKTLLPRPPRAKNGGGR